MRTSTAPGFGISRSTISKSPPGFEICATFIGAIPTFVVAIIPPLNFQLLSRGPREGHPGHSSQLCRPSRLLPVAGRRDGNANLCQHTAAYVLKILPIVAFMKEGNCEPFPLI